MVTSVQRSLGALEHIRSVPTQKRMGADARCLTLTKGCVAGVVRADLDVDESEPVESETIGLVVAHIKRMVRMAGLDFALRVGALIIHHFYDGEADAWRSRGPKLASFRSLARHPELPLSAGSLYRCVAVYELCERLNAPSRWEYLGASHLRMVLGLPGDVQEKVLAAANAKRWTVKVLQQAVRRERAGRRDRGGRRAQPLITKNLAHVGKCLTDDFDALTLEQVSCEDLQRSILLVREVQGRLARLMELVQAAMESRAGMSLQVQSEGA